MPRERHESDYNFSVLILVLSVELDDIDIFDKRVWIGKADDAKKYRNATKVTKAYHHEKGEKIQYSINHKIIYPVPAQVCNESMACLFAAPLLRVALAVGWRTRTAAFLNPRTDHYCDRGDYHD